MYFRAKFIQLVSLSVSVIRVSAVLVSLVLVSCGTLTGSNKENEQILNRLNLELINVPEKTLMMQAAEQGNSVLLKQAFATGESINSVSPEGTAFFLAIEHGHLSIAKILLAAGCDWQVGFEHSGSNALIKSSERGFNDIVKQIILKDAISVDALDADGYSAIAKAAIRGHLTTVKILINAGADVDVAPEGRSLLMHTVEDNNLLIAQLLIAAGADVNYRDEFDMTALKIARKLQFYDLDLMLVQSGARP